MAYCSHLVCASSPSCLLPAPAAPELGALADVPLDAWRAEAARRSLRRFVDLAWPIVEPAHKLKPGWHLDALCDHLEAFARGQILRLIINQPPGTAKSLLASVMMPAWIWTWRAEWRGLFASYADKLARRDSNRTRNLVTAPLYKNLYGIELDDDRDDDFSNRQTGRRMSTSVSGRSTGFRAHAVVVDDPISVPDSLSEAARESAIRWYTQALPSRLDDVEHAGMLVVMQRTHERDLAGHLLAAELGYEHLNLRAEYDPRRSTVTSLGVYDRRTEENELLCPAIHSREFLDDQRKSMGDWAFSSQYNQDPQPLDGGVIKTSAWRYFREPGAPAVQPRPHGAWTGNAIELPKLDVIEMSIDLGMKDGSHNDNSAFAVIGMSRAQPADRFLLDLVARPMDLNQQIATLLELRERWPLARRILVEDSANYAAMKSVLGSRVSGIVPVRAEGPKPARIMALTPSIESGHWYLRDGAPWVDDLLSEAGAWPNGRRDDRLDALAQHNLAPQAVDIRAKWKSMGPDPREERWLQAHGHRFRR